MNYIEIKIHFSAAEPWKEIFSSFLADAGCESFMDGDTDNDLLCYIPDNLYDADNIKNILENHGFTCIGENKNGNSYHYRADCQAFLCRIRERII